MKLILALMLSVVAFSVSANSAARKKVLFVLTNEAWNHRHAFRDSFQ